MSRSTERQARPALHQLSTSGAAAVAGVVFAILFGISMVLVRTNMPEGAKDSSEWLTTQRGGIATAAVLMPFAVARDARLQPQRMTDHRHVGQLAANGVVVIVTPNPTVRTIVSATTAAADDIGSDNRAPRSVGDKA